jgi:hypothetical protein
MTYSLPLRLMILQSALRFFMDALTFISLSIYLYLNTILPFVKSYGDISSRTLSPGKMRM